ncbi:hypothetical protein AGIG_G10361 [Arapaima gigas]
MLTSLQLRLQWKILAPQPDRAELETREKKRAAIRRRPVVVLHQRGKGFEPRGGGSSSRRRCFSLVRLRSRASVDEGRGLSREDRLPQAGRQTGLMEASP